MYMADTAAPSSELEHVFARHYRDLVRVLTVAAGDRSRAEDAVQDAFAQALLHWPRVGAYDDPVAWLRRVATNRVLNQRRSSRRRDAAIARLQARPEPVVAPQGLVGSRLDLIAAVARLPLKQRTAVAFFYLADLSSEQVAAAMGISEGAVRFHLHAARKTLTSTLEVN
jgi:RNA polymerase sigma-70 factor (ECF subfamily)